MRSMMLNPLETLHMGCKPTFGFEQKSLLSVGLAICKHPEDSPHSQSTDFFEQDTDLKNLLCNRSLRMLRYI